MEAHIILSKQRHWVEAEVTLRLRGQTLVVTAQNANAFTALNTAVAKLEKQSIRSKHKWVDGRRSIRQRDEPPAAVQAAIERAATPETMEPAPERSGPRIVRGNGMAGKPLTVDEAAIMLEDENRDQVTYRDAETGGLCVLLRRRDGAFELVETGA